MEYIYDNGEKLIGEKKKLEIYFKKCIEKAEDNKEEVEEILEDIKDYEEDTILVINYDCGMGYMIDYWDRIDRVMED